MYKLISLFGYIDKQFYFPISQLIFLMFACAILEVISIGAVMPFILVLVSPEKIFEYELFFFLKDYSISTISFLLVVSFIAIVIISMFSRILLLWKLSRTSFDIGVQLSNQMYRNIINQPYKFFIQNNSSDLTERLTIQNQRLIFHLIHPMFMITSSLLICFFIIIVLFVVDWKLTLTTGSFFFFTYYLISSLSKKRLLTNSEVIKKENSKIFKLMQESFGGMRDTIINNTGRLYSSTFFRRESKLRNAEAVNLLFGVAPRYFIEGLGIVFIIVTAIYLKQQSSSTAEMIGTIAILALAAQRLLPVIQNIYQSYVLVSGANATLVNVVDTLKLNETIRNKNNINTTEISLESKIKLNDINFSYPGTNQICLQDINLEISKGENIGIIGPTGSGKTTLVDIIIGLLEPTSGEMKIDGETINEVNQHQWFKRVSHVPQNIFMSDSSILENIGIKNIESISQKDVIEASKVSEINNYIESLDNKYQTIIGEQGVKLSGGQRQRIGIARAIYKLNDLLVMDEATSALDNDTEKRIVENLKNYDPNLTIVMVAHRISSLSICDKIYEIEKGSIKGIYTYKELLNKVETER